MKYRCSLSFALLAASLSVSAHNVLPGVNWCENGKAIEIGDINFGGGDTKSYRECVRRSNAQSVCRLSTTVVSARPCPAQTCGEFDDDYRSARHLAQNYCDELAAVTDPNSPYFGMQTVPIFTGPDTLTDMSAHHTSYEVNDGVYGACMVCVGETSER